MEYMCYDRKKKNYARLAQRLPFAQTRHLEAEVPPLIQTDTYINFSHYFLEEVREDAEGIWLVTFY